MSQNSLTQLLQSAGLLEHGYSAETHPVDSPWYVKALLGLSGWLAAICLLVFFGFWLQSLLLKEGVSLTIGSALIGTAIVLLRLPKNEFYEHLGFAVSLAGQGLLLFALANYLKGLNSQLYLPIAIVQIVLLYLIPNYTHRVYSSFIATIALSLFMSSLGYLFVFKIILLLAMSKLWLNEFDYPEKIKMLQAIGYGFVLSEFILSKTISLLYFNLFDHWLPREINLDAWLYPWMHEIPATLAMLFIASQQIKRLEHSLAHPLSLIFLLLVIAINALSIEINNLNIGLIILLLGYAGSNRILIGLGIITLLSAVTSYYYFMNTTLLVKSQILIGSGLLLLVIRWLIQRFSANQEETKYAS